MINRYDLEFKGNNSKLQNESRGGGASARCRWSALNHFSIMFKNAGSAEIIRSHQKDEFYLFYLRSCVSDISQAMLGKFTKGTNAMLNISNISGFIRTTLYTVVNP